MAEVVRVTVSLQSSTKSSVVIVKTFDDLLRQCSSKFLIKARRIFHATTGEELVHHLNGITNDTKLIVTEGDVYTVNHKSGHVKHDKPDNIVPIQSTIVANRTLIEETAVEQLNNLPRFYSKIKRLWGMPDLHAGQSTPIGCVVATEPDIVYPELIGTDIGCGMSFVRTSLRLITEDDERKLMKWTKQLQGLDDCLPKDIVEQYLQMDLNWPQNVDRIDEDHPENEQLGTIGSGNHFVELQRIEELYDDSQEDLSTNFLYLLVHSGSRSLGERILREFVQNKEDRGGLAKGTESYENYMKKHDQACAWAKRNRFVIADRFLHCLGDTTDRHCILDIWHNNVVLRQLQTDQSFVHLHRKGAAPSDQGRVVIPGSRGTHSYLVEPIEQNQESSGYSLAHGAGRAMSRSKARQQLTEKYPNADQLRITDKLESHVICENKQLLYEEHPQAYKTIDAVIDDLVEAKLIRVLAKLRPLITYKTRSSH